MTPRTEAVDAVLAALDLVDGVRPAAPVAPGLLPWDVNALAVDLLDDTAVVHLVALSFPLAPVLDSASAAVRAALAGTRWGAAEVRLVVTGVDAAAFTGTAPRRDLDHPIGS
ncbi:hypothetical protein [Actinokineospora bangkokensis]|uniref:MIP18 family-like domain-containing protein n=1 Tax=Actinokineospora bangkokensis TaxID=1193682 RepID=A0A1Q9LMM1_9PSEU|nr:hypothetical protein [Actinokineospora bangkokensis]OLR93278.1 hypothetical protein BJP25_17505 [Actinokineospora bangkokensis]